MSCDDNNEARAKDRVRRARSRSPIVGVRQRAGGAPAAAAARRYWRSIEERHAARSTLAAPSNASSRPAPPSCRRRARAAGSCSCSASSTALATIGAACRKPNEKIIPFVRRPEELTPGNALHFATGVRARGLRAAACWSRATRGAPRRSKATPRTPRRWARRPRSSRRSSWASMTTIAPSSCAAAARRSPGRPSWRTSGALAPRRWRRTAAPGCASSTSPTASPLLADLRRRILEKFPQGQVRQLFARSPPTARSRAPSWRSGAR